MLRKEKNMEISKNLEEIFYKGELINLKKTSIEDLEKMAKEIDSEQKDIKNYIFDILEKN